MSHIATTNPRPTNAWSDSGYHTNAIGHGATLGIDVDRVTR